MSYAIVFSSRTGNTALLAQTLQEQMPAQTAAISAHRTLPHWQQIPCMWAFDGQGQGGRRHTGFLQQLHGKRVFLFGTAGFGGSAPTLKRSFCRHPEGAGRAIPSLAALCVRASMPVSVRQRY